MVSVANVPPVPYEKVPIAYRSQISRTISKRLCFPVQISENSIGYISKEKYDEYFTWNTVSNTFAPPSNGGATKSINLICVFNTQTTSTTSKEGFEEILNTVEEEEEEEEEIVEEDFNSAIQTNLKAPRNVWYKKTNSTTHKQYHDSFNAYIETYSKKQAVSSLIASASLNVLQAPLAKVQGFAVQEGDFLYRTKMTIFMFYFAIVVYINVTNANATTHSALFNLVVPLLSPNFEKQWPAVSARTRNILEKRFWKHVRIPKTHQIEYHDATGNVLKNPHFSMFNIADVIQHQL
jgi:hypothetical protein